MPVYKLHYFDAKGIAEVSRLLLAAAGVEYEDIRIQPEDWPAKKASESRIDIEVNVSHCFYNHRSRHLQAAPCHVLW
jgi:hypothetical protein